MDELGLGTRDVFNHSKMTCHGWETNSSYLSYEWDLSLAVMKQMQRVRFSTSSSEFQVGHYGLFLMLQMYHINHFVHLA